MDVLSSASVPRLEKSSHGENHFWTERQAPSRTPNQGEFRNRSVGQRLRILQENFGTIFRF